MICINDFQKFLSVIGNLKESNIPVFLYGKSEEKFSGAYAGLGTPPNNTFSLRIAALTSVGTIYCSDSIKLSNSEEVKNAKRLLEELSVFPADVLYKSESGNVVIR